MKGKPYHPTARVEASHSPAELKLNSPAVASIYATIAGYGTVPRPRHREQCAMPFKMLNTASIDMAAVLEMAPARHKSAVLEAAAILGGSHAAWAPLLAAAPTDGPPSRLTRGQLSQLVRWGVLRPTCRGHGLVSRAFAVPKSDGVTARPILDARAQNDLIDWSSVRTSLRLLPILAHVRVGLAVGRKDPLLAEVDAKSYFPSFRWSRGLRRAHVVRVGDQCYTHEVPAQGSALMPLVAQVASASLAKAPPLHAHPDEWVRQGVSIVYDNWLLSGERDCLPGRLSRLTGRLERAGVVVGSVQQPARTVESCGFQFEVGPSLRRWRLKPDWVARVVPILERGWPDDLLGRQRVAGLCLWALRATLRPLWSIRRILEFISPDLPSGSGRSSAAAVLPGRGAGLTRSPRKAAASAPVDGCGESVTLTTPGGVLREVLGWLRHNEWRTLLSAPMSLREAAPVVAYADASLWAAGYVDSTGRVMHSPWLDAPRLPSRQQTCEMEGAAIAVAACAPQGGSLLLVVDNSGVFFSILSGNPRTVAGVKSMAAMEGTLRGRCCRLAVALVPTKEMLADAASRGDDTPVVIPPSTVSRLVRMAVDVDWTWACPCP